MLMNGWTMTGNSEGMSITNRVGGVINFDIVVKTRHGAVFAAWFVRNAEINVASTDKGISMSIRLGLGLGLDRLSPENLRNFMFL
jgi:hypothetical protein